jgi:hypothetical protein
MPTKSINLKLGNVIASCECLYSEQTLPQFLFDGTFIAKMPTKHIIPKLGNVITSSKCLYLRAETSSVFLLMALSLQKCQQNLKSQSSEM